MTDNATFEIPSEPEHLSADWLTTALSAAGIDATVANVKCTRIGEGVGFIGQIYRLTIDYSDPPQARAAGAPESLVAKMPTSEQGGRFMGMFMKLYEREAGFYRNLATQVPVRVPHCYFNGADSEAGKWCLLLEDMRAYEVGNQLVPLDLDRSRLLVTSLGTMHGQWSGGRTETLDWLPRANDPIVTSIIPMFEASVGPVTERYGHLFPDDMIDIGPRFYPHTEAWVNEFAALPSTLVHGDFRTDNIAFSPTDPNDFAVLDWQVMSRQPGAYDLYYFLAQCPDPTVSCGHFDELVDTYLQSFTNAGGTPPARGDLLHQMRGIGLFFSVLGTVTLAQIDPANKRGEELFLSMWQRGLELARHIDLRTALP